MELKNALSCFKLQRRSKHIEHGSTGCCKPETRSAEFAEIAKNHMRFDRRKVIKNSIHGIAYYLDNSRNSRIKQSRHKVHSRRVGLNRNQKKGLHMGTRKIERNQKLHKQRQT